MFTCFVATDTAVCSHQLYAKRPGCSLQIDRIQPNSCSIVIDLCSVSFPMLLVLHLDCSINRPGSEQTVGQKLSQWTVMTALHQESTHRLVESFEGFPLLKFTLAFSCHDSTALSKSASFNRRASKSFRSFINLDAPGLGLNC